MERLGGYVRKHFFDEDKSFRNYSKKNRNYVGPDEEKHLKEIFSTKPNDRLVSTFIPFQRKLRPQFPRAENCQSKEPHSKDLPTLFLRENL